MGTNPSRRILRQSLLLILFLRPLTFCLAAEEPPAQTEPPATGEAEEPPAVEDTGEGGETGETAEPAAEAAEADDPPKPKPRRRPKRPPVPQRTPEQMAGDKLVIEALGHVQEGQFREADEKFKLALESDPGNATAHTYACFLAFRRGEFNPARLACEAALEIAPNIPLALLVVARIDEAGRNLETAESGYEMAAIAGASSPTAQTDGGLAISGHSRFLLAILQAQRGDAELAIENLEETIRVFPTNAYAHYEKGLELLALGRNEEAAEALGKSLAERENWFSSEAWLGPIRRYLFLEENAHYWRGVALSRAGRYEEASEELLPLLPSVESRLGSEMQVEAGDPGDLLRILEGETELSYYRTHLELAKVLHELGRGKEAVGTLRSYLRVELKNKTRIKEAKTLLKTVK